VSTCRGWWGWGWVGGVCWGLVVGVAVRTVIMSGGLVC
jgi:hypothetical protein